GPRACARRRRTRRDRQRWIGTRLVDSFCLPGATPRRFSGEVRLAEIADEGETGTANLTGWPRHPFLQDTSPGGIAAQRIPFSCDPGRRRPVIDPGRTMGSLARRNSEEEVA